MRKPTWLIIGGSILLLVGVLGLWAVEVVSAASLQPALPETVVAQAAGDETDTQTEPSSAYCLLCHAQEGRTWTLPSGEVLSLTIDQGVLSRSVHGEDNPEGALQCADCHTNHRYPHQPQIVQNTREFELQRYASCRNCHEDQYTHLQDSVHGAALREGKLEAATCVDCHGGHNIQPPAEPRERISLTCGKCHGAIFDQYRNSVHGTALLADSNPDVPTCIDCHGVHDISNPTTALFRVRSPELCAGCHADRALMSKYNISTNVFDSYLTDFHGATVALFNQEDPNSATNKAVCYDCHGVHDIAAVTEETSHVIRENLLDTCRQCHPGATADFPNAWVGHFPPTLDSHPLLFVVNLFYTILIPGVLGGFVFLIATDVIRRIRERLGLTRH
ncbi:MAG: cytochrome c3 family protein [Anaerolineae bacterium]|nr:cytochrome c3 family protein [Anaerolineae bacterium]